MQTYDINEAGQVHTYIVYLATLPYEEQLYWKAYNEKPKGGISKRAFETDFRGSWDQEYDALISLKAALHEWNRAQVPWWTLRAENLPDQVHYPVTSSHDEWANEILHLDQFVVEGFETKWLRTTAMTLGRNLDAKQQSLALLAECLVGLGFSQDDARRIVDPLKTAHTLRTKLKGHASGEEAVGIRKQILTAHGSYKKHFRVLTEAIDQSIRTIQEAFRETDEGRRDAFVFLSAGLSMRAKVHAVAVSVGETQQVPQITQAQELLERTSGSPHLEQALSLWADQMRYWPRLYRSMEEIEQHLGKRVDVAGLCTPNQRERFTRTANTAEVSGPDARHATGKFAAPSNPMSLPEATEFVRKMLLSVLR